MTQATSGGNRTGIHSSPTNSRAMQFTEQAEVSAYDAGAQSAALRRAYIVNADLLGSVPLPVNAVGTRPTATNLHVLLDKLGERLASERIGTRLYDALITKFEATQQEGILSMSLNDLKAMRDDEARHFLLVAQTIEAFGGDPTALTPSADLAGVEAMGLVQVLNDPRTTLGQSLHAILAAELSDQVGWETLIALMGEQDDLETLTHFITVLSDEFSHVIKIQTWYDEAMGIPPLFDEDDFDDDDEDDEDEFDDRVR